MKTTVQLFIATVFMSMLMVACAEAPEGQKVEAEDAVSVESTEASDDAMVYMVDTDASVINWVGSKPGGEHMGTVKVSTGELLVENDELVGGNFVLDMNSIANKDLAGTDKQAKLEGHLKTGDFFEVETYPTATFAITSVEPATDNPDANYNLTGNLTMKGVTKSVTVPAKVEITENGVMASTPKFTINRTEWGVNFKSGLLGAPKDEAIHDEIGLQIDLKSAPQTANM
ncbi:MAG: YceI family protein [Saprospiraceae bacterium]|nr:YceI family protein [Lewinella sp.]